MAVVRFLGQDDALFSLVSIQSINQGPSPNTTIISSIYTSLPLLNIRPQIQLKRKRSPRLGMQIPIRVRNLRPISIQQQQIPSSFSNSPNQDSTSHPHEEKPTASCAGYQ